MLTAAMRFLIEGGGGISPRSFEMRFATRLSLPGAHASALRCSRRRHTSRCSPKASARALCRDEDGRRVMAGRSSVAKLVVRAQRDTGRRKLASVAIGTFSTSRLGHSGLDEPSTELGARRRIGSGLVLGLVDRASPSSNSGEEVLFSARGRNETRVTCTACLGRPSRAECATRSGR